MTISALPRHLGGQATLLGAFYAASFLVVGIQLPFWPVWLAGRGLDAQEIALVFAAAIWAKVVATPLLGALADRLRRRRAVMIVLAACAWAAYAGLWPAAGFWSLLALNLVAGMAQSALMPLGDSITLAAVREEGLDYGRIRVWGSVSFILASVGSGALLAASSPAGPADNQILLLVLAASAVLVAACIGIPPPTGGSGSLSPALRRCNRATSSITASEPFIGASSAFPTRSSAGCGPRGSSPRSCCSGTARRSSPASGRSD